MPGSSPGMTSVLARTQSDYSNSGSHDSAFSPRDPREFCFEPSAFRTLEGAGNAGRPPRPQTCVRNEKAHKHSHYGHTGNTRHSPRNGFNGFLRALPGDRAFLSPSPRGYLPQSLTPASRRQDHTTSPSARQALSSVAPPVSTASRPACVTIASRPSEEAGRGELVKMICPTAKAENFFEQDWTDKISLICLRKFRFPRNGNGPDRANPHVSRTRCNASSAVHRRAGTNFRWAPDQQRTANALRSIRGTPNSSSPGTTKALCRLIARIAASDPSLQNERESSDLLQRFDLDDRGAVVVADPERDGCGGIVDEHPPDIGTARQEIVDRRAGGRIEPGDLIAQHRAGPGFAVLVGDDVIGRRPFRRDLPLPELFGLGVEHADAIGAIFAEPQPVLGIHAATARRGIRRRDFVQLYRAGFGVDPPDVALTEIGEIDVIPGVRNDVVNIMRARHALERLKG